MQRLYKSYGEKEILKLVVGEIAQQLMAYTPLKRTWVQFPAQHDYNNSSRGLMPFFWGSWELGLYVVYIHIYTYMCVTTIVKKESMHWKRARRSV